MGCKERYDAKESAKMNVMLAPCAAFANAVRMKKLVSAEVGLAMQVAMVNGLNKKL